MAVSDPVDARLLALVADVGRVAVHDLAKRAGMDVREVAARLAALASSGLPLVVGVECDPNALRYALASHAVPGAYGAPSGPYQVNQPSGPYSGPFPAQPYQQQQPYSPVQHPYGGSGPVPSNPYGPGPHQGGSGPHQAGSGPHTVGSGPHTYPHPPQPALDQPSGRHSGRVPDPIGTWGPPGVAAWARGDAPGTQPEQPSATITMPAPPGTAIVGRRTGTVGERLLTEGIDGEQLAIQLVEVVDPADFLFTAAGYKLQAGERSVVVHTELTNRGGASFSSVPDLYLVLIDDAGRTVAKAPVSLSSRPPHRIGVQPGETAGGHTVYVLPEATTVAAVRWSPRPGDDARSLTWTVE